MAARSSSSWPAAAFSGPCTLGLLHLFGSTVPEAATYQQTLTAVSGCHLWRVDCAEAARRLLERHPEALQEVAKLLIKVGGVCTTPPRSWWGSGPSWWGSLADACTVCISNTAWVATLAGGRE